MNPWLASLLYHGDVFISTEDSFIVAITGPEAKEMRQWLLKESGRPNVETLADPHPDLITIKEAAHLMGMTRDGLYKRLKSGKLKSYTQNHQKMVKRSDILRLIEFNPPDDA